MLTASVCAPPEASRIAPNIEPSPTNSAIPFNVFPIPSFTAVTMLSKGIPAPKPITIAPTKMETIACTLNLMINKSNTARPTIAAITNLVGSNAIASLAIAYTSSYYF